ncbi:MAG: hypothetical protein K8H85_01705 [Cyclobacteriaceae bacterium]|nr:hypothetical protein [Cyclobacteriaceae bacterium]
MAIQQFHTAAELRIAIHELEIKLTNEWPPLKEQLLATAETLKPKNILKDTIGEVFSKPGLKTTALSTTLGLATMLGANFIFPARTTSRLTKMVTGAIIGITTIGKIVKNGNQIKLMGSNLLKRLSGRKETL